MAADKAKDKKAKKDIVTEAANESVKEESEPSLILFVIGTAVDAADISRYATLCTSIYFILFSNLINNLHIILHNFLPSTFIFKSLKF